MDGHTRYPVKGFRPEQHVATIAFRPNGSGAVSNTLNVGSLKGKATVTRTTTGTYTVVLASGMSFPERPVFQVSGQGFDQASNRVTAGAGEWNNTTRTLTVYTWQTDGTPADITSNAAAWVNIVVHAINSTGK